MSGAYCSALVLGYFYYLLCKMSHPSCSIYHRPPALRVKFSMCLVSPGVVADMLAHTPETTGHPLGPLPPNNPNVGANTETTGSWHPRRPTPGPRPGSRPSWRCRGGCAICVFGWSGGRDSWWC